MVLDLKTFPKIGMGYSCTICKTPGWMVQKISVVSVKTGKRWLGSHNHFPENFQRDEPFHLNCPRNYRVFHNPGAWPKIPEISIGISNGTDHFGLVRPKVLGPALRLVLFDRSGQFGLSDRNIFFHYWSKLLSPVLLFCILLSRTIGPFMRGKVSVRRALNKTRTLRVNGKFRLK